MQCLRPKSVLAIALLTTLTPIATAQDTDESVLSGRVQNRQGKAIEQARVWLVTDAGNAQPVFTDSLGQFSLRGCTPPCTLLVSHPRFQEQAVDVADAESPIQVELVGKQEVFEEIEVTASRGEGQSFTPVSVASTPIKTEELAAPPTSLLEVVEGVAGVAENGQGGLFQVFSIRGVSRRRVATLVSGVPIVGERRAGVSTSWIDPLLMGNIEVLRGPASTYYGSGALGGVAQVFPRGFEELNVATGYQSAGDERYLRVGWGDGQWSLGLARRESDRAEDAEGGVLDNRFEQISATIARRWKAGNRSYEILAVPTFGKDIGKASTDFPDTITTYPEERHLLLRFHTASEAGDSLSVFAHANDLITEDLEPGQSLATVENEALDFGGDWQRQWAASNGMAGRYGVDYFGRRGVTADEVQIDLVSGSETLRQTTLNDASLDEAGAYGSLRWQWAGTTVEAGGRFTWQQQDNRGNSSKDDTAWTGFLGLTRPLAGSFELTANIGTGLRFPSLSERFFSGTTGRGEVIGNPELDPERSLNADLGLRWYGARTFVAAHVFRLAIDDYIERIEIAPDLLTFVNLTEGTIDGLELEGFHRPNDRWMLTWSGHRLSGEDEGGSPLADIPSDRLQLGAQLSEGSWQGRLTYQYRLDKDDPGSGEKVIPEAHLVSAGLTYRLSNGLELSVTGRNLLDETYFNSADRRVPLAVGRSVGFGLSWRAGAAQP